MTYTAAALVGVVGAALVDLVLLRTMLLRRKAFWTSYAIVAFFQLIVNGLLTGLDVVRYDPRRILGARIVYAPVEDLLFGFAMVLITLSLWVWWGRVAVRRHGRDAAPARSRAAR
jgi:lycopene cyclase domain-containing protein